MEDLPEITSTPLEGPGTTIGVSSEAPKPLLDGAGEYEFVDILNPLSVDFSGKFGIERPTNPNVRMTITPGMAIISKSADDIRRNYGLDLTNPDHQPKARIVNTVIIPAGKIRRMLGHEAQVVVRQLVTLVMQKEEHQILLSDPFARNAVEQRVIVRRGNLQDMPDFSITSVQEQLKEAINEDEFPEAARSQENSLDQQDTRAGNAPSNTPVESPGRKPGRPAKSR